MAVKKKKTLLTGYISKELDTRMRKYCEERNYSLSDFAEYVISNFLDQKSDMSNFIRFQKRLDRRIDRLDSHVSILTEAFSLYLKFWFAHGMELPESEKKAAWLSGQARYLKFIDYLKKEIKDSQFVDHFITPVADEQMLRDILDREQQPDDEGERGRLGEK